MVVSINMALLTELFASVAHLHRLVTNLSWHINRTIKPLRKIARLSVHEIERRGVRNQRIPVSQIRGGLDRVIETWDANNAELDPVAPRGERERQRSGRRGID